MTVLLTITNTLLFTFLSSIHIYWAFGGKWGLSNALPELPQGSKKAFEPSRISTLIVALVLLFFAFLTLGNIIFLDTFFETKHIKYSMLFIGILFIIRAIGDFNYVGITKKVKNTQFATYDNCVYIPLCVAIGCISLILFSL